MYKRQVCAAFFEQRLLDHLNTHANKQSVDIINRSSEWGALTINGPKSRQVLSKCTDAALDNKHFGWLKAQQINIGDQSCWAFRMSYAGELGWEIHTESENILAVYDALWKAGTEYNIADYGSFSMNVMRMEKMFKGAGELTNEVTLPEANVMRFAKMDKDFIGKQKTQESLNKPLPWVCAYLHIEANGTEDGNGGEAVIHNGTVVGSLASVAYGHSVGKILAFAYIKPHAATAGTELTVVIAGKDRPAVVHDKPAYDPESILPRTDS